MSGVCRRIIGLQAAVFFRPDLLRQGMFDTGYRCGRGTRSRAGPGRGNKGETMMSVGRGADRQVDESATCGSLPKICVAYLARHGNPVAAVGNFVESYRKYPAGIAHDLLIIWKGGGSASFSPEAALVGDIPHRNLALNDIGYDLHAYFRAARQTAYDYYLFLNSFSVILADDWLLRFWTHVSRKDIGLVGATGSFESHYTYYCSLTVRERIPVLGVDVRVPGFVRWSHRLVIQRWRRRRLLDWYEPFPNPHVRTNAFMISRENMLQVYPGPLLTKTRTHRFESGRDGLTHRILRMGLRVLVVGKNGIGYDVDDWPRSGTFWQEAQKNLLISDNQTRRFENSPAPVRDAMTRTAWGAALPAGQE